MSPKGQPVIIRRTDLVVSLNGYQRPDRQTGEMRDHTAVTLEGGAVLFIDGHAEVIEAAIVAHEHERSNLTMERTGDVLDRAWSPSSHLLKCTCGRTPGYCPDVVVDPQGGVRCA